MNHALQNDDVELWHVEVAPNDIRVLTLEQLDEAFQQGLVNERTRVFQDGMDEPAFLGELLGLGDDDDEEERSGEHEQPVAAAPPARAPEPKRIHQQTLVGLHAEPPRSVPQHRGGHSGPPAYSPAQQSGVRPVHSSPPPAMPSQRPQGPYAAGPHSAPAPVRRGPVADSAWPPVVSRSPGQPSSLPPAASSPSTISGVVAPSVVPMAMDLGAMDDLEYPRPKSKGKFVVIGLGVVAVAAGVALAVTGQGASLLSSFTASAAAPSPTAKPKPAVDTQSHAYDPGNAPVKLKEAPEPVVITTRENETDQLKAAGMTTTTAAEASKATATADAKSSPLAKPSSKKVAVSSKRAKSAPAAPRRSGGGAPKGPFKAGGDTHDPLNGSL